MPISCCCTIRYKTWNFFCFISSSTCTLSLPPLQACARIGTTCAQQLPKNRPQGLVKKQGLLLHQRVWPGRQHVRLPVDHAVYHGPAKSGHLPRTRRSYLPRVLGLQGHFQCIEPIVCNRPIYTGRHFDRRVPGRGRGRAHPTIQNISFL